MTNLRHDAVIAVSMSDSTIEFATIWAAALKGTGCKLPVFVIPFSRKVEKVANLCKHYGFELLQHNDEPWVDLGRMIYGHEDYRPGVSRANYFSKLSVFDLPAEIFIYLDTNAIPLQDPTCLVDPFLISRKDILFEWRLNRLGRNFATEEDKIRLNQLNPDVELGWGMQCFIGKTSAIDKTKCSELAERPNIRQSFGDAPEQSFLTAYIAEFGVPVGVLRTFYKDAVGVSCRDKLSERDGAYFVVKNGIERRARFIKWNGRDTGIGVPNHAILMDIDRRFRPSTDPVK